MEDFAINDDGVVLRTSTGEEFHARYLVDGSGHKSVVANKFGLRQAVPDAAHPVADHLHPHEGVQAV